MLILAIILISNSCKDGHKPPSLKVCATANTVGFLCNDESKPEGEQDSFEPYRSGYICFDQPDFSQLYSYCADLRKDLIKCERKCD